MKDEHNAVSGLYGQTNYSYFSVVLCKIMRVFTAYRIWLTTSIEIFSLIGYTDQVHSQPSPVQWNVIKISDFSAPLNSLDSLYGAVVLSDFGTVSYEDVQGELKTVYYRHTRIR